MASKSIEKHSLFEETSLVSVQVRLHRRTILPRLHCFNYRISTKQDTSMINPAGTFFKLCPVDQTSESFDISRMRWTRVSDLPR